jgi:hypothetical protein
LLRAEGVAYAEKLRASDALLEHREFKGVDYAFNVVAADTDLTREMCDPMAQHIGKVRVA